MADDGRVIVVGSGPPGASAAVFLSRAGVDVLLLEAGSERASLGLTSRVRGITVFRIHRALRKRERVTATGDPAAGLFEELAPGGLSNHWSCAVPRFAPEDFADAARAGEQYVWPIGYDDLAPWYDQVEPLLCIAGEVQGSPQLPAGAVRRERRLAGDWAPIAHEARRLGRSVVAMPYAYGAETTLTPTGTVFNSFVRLVKPELRSGRLAIRYDSRVVRLDYSPAKRVVDAVVVRDARTGTESRVSCRAVVLAAGAVGSCEILLTSSSPEFPDGLGNTNDVLGRYLHDHPLAKVAIDLARPISVHPASYFTRPTVDRAPPLYAAAGMQWSGAAMLARSLATRRPGRLPWVGFNLFGTMAPSHDDWLALDGDGRGRNGARALNLHIRHPPQAKEALEKTRDDLLDTLAGAGLMPRVRTWTIEPPCTSVHYGGTCRMHASPRFGMLDGWNRLHAVRNVVVADSAAFTTGPEKNPVLTAMALAARAGNRLAHELRAGDL